MMPFASDRRRDRLTSHSLLGERRQQNQQGSGAARSRRCHCHALFGVTWPAVLPAVSYRDVRRG